VESRSGPRQIAAGRPFPGSHVSLWFFAHFPNAPVGENGKTDRALTIFPALAEIYRQRMLAVKHPWGTGWISVEVMQDTYKHLSWEYLQALARQNGLSYVIQFRDIAYPATPVFTNNHFAIYEVNPKPEPAS